MVRADCFNHPVSKGSLKKPPYLLRVIYGADLKKIRLRMADIVAPDFSVCCTTEGQEIEDFGKCIGRSVSFWTK